MIRLHSICPESPLSQMRRAMTSGVPKYPLSRRIASPEWIPIRISNDTPLKGRLVACCISIAQRRASAAEANAASIPSPSHCKFFASASRDGVTQHFVMSAEHSLTGLVPQPSEVLGGIDNVGE